MAEKLDWFKILGPSPCQELQGLYETMPLARLAKHLGVGYETLRQKMIRCHVKIRKPGGPRYKFPRERLPDGAHNLDTESLMVLTGFTATHCRKIKRDLRRKNETR